MEVLTARKKRGIVFVNVAIFVIGVITCVLLYLAKGSTDSLPSVLCLFVGLQIASIMVSFCLFVKIDKNWQFDAVGLVEQNVIRRDKLIRYSDVKAIAIFSAVNSRFFPICDEQGVSKAVIAIYDNWSVARSQMSPDAIFVLPATPSLGSLSCSFFLLGEKTARTCDLIAGGDLSRASGGKAADADCKAICARKFESCIVHHKNHTEKCGFLFYLQVLSGICTQKVGCIPKQ